MKCWISPFFVLMGNKCKSSCGKQRSITVFFFGISWYYIITKCCLIWAFKWNMQLNKVETHQSWSVNLIIIPHVFFLHRKESWCDFYFQKESWRVQFEILNWINFMTDAEELAVASLFLPKVGKFAALFFWPVTGRTSRYCVQWIHWNNFWKR